MWTSRPSFSRLSPRWRLGLLLGVGALLLLEALYNALLLNGLLGTWLTQDIIHDGHTVIRFTHGWSVVPGHVYVRELLIQREEDDGTRWSLEMDRVDANISVLALLGRELRTSSVEVWGLTAHVKLPDSGGAPGQPTPPPPDAFQFALHRILVHDVHELQWELARVTGITEVSGNLDLKPGFRVFIEDAHLALGPGDFVHDRVHVAHLERGSAAVTLEALRKEGQGLDLVADLKEARLQLATTLPSLEGVKRLSRKLAGLPVRGGAGHLDADIHVKDGRLALGTKISGAGEPFVLPVVKPLELRAPWKLDADVYTEPKSGEERLGLEVKLGPVRLVGGEDKAAAAMESQAVVLSMSSKPPRLNEGLPDVHLLLEAARSKPLNLRVLNGWLSPSFQVESGHLTLEASSRASPTTQGAGEAHLFLTTEDVLAHWGAALLGGHLVLDVDAYKLAFLKDTVTLNGSQLKLRDIHVRTGSTQNAQGWDGTLSFPQATLSLSPFGFSGRFEGSFSSAAPIIAMLAQQGALPRVLTPLLEAKNLELSGQVVLGNKGVKLERVRARGQGLDIHARADTTGSAPLILALVKLGALPLGLESDAQGLHFQVLGPSAWYEKKTGEKPE